jgi:hypothetical protein
MRDLYKRLTADGVDAWLDVENLIAGQNWQVEIPKAIRESDVVIVCLSEKSINREGYVQKEIKFALDVADEKPEGTIFIVPVRLEVCVVPDRLSMYHWVNFFEKNGYEKLMRSLRLREGIDSTELVYKNEMKYVRDIMDKNLLIVDSKTSIEFILKEFKEKNFRAALIKGKQRSWWIFSVTDFLMVLGQGLSLEKVTVGEFASIANYFASPDWTYERRLLRW